MRETEPTRKPHREPIVSLNRWLGKDGELDLGKAGESLLMGLALLPVRMAVTWGRYLFGRASRFRLEDDDAATTGSIPLAPPLIYAAIFCYCNAFCSMLEDLKLGDAEPVSAMASLFNMMQASLDSPSAISIFKGFAVLLIWVASLASGFAIAGRAACGKGEFVGLLRFAGYAWGTFMGLGVVAFILRSLFMSAGIVLPEYHLIRRGVMFALMAWFLWRSVALLRAHFATTTWRASLILGGGALFLAGLALLSMLIFSPWKAALKLS
jgi:hypothetical protein